ncbi:hypothetical protein C2E23DRAFT_731862, partial [Lenzites betulinus]
MALYRGSNGQYHFGSIDIPPDYLEEFADTFRANLRNSRRLGVPFFQIELRGTKGMYSFPFGNIEARQDALNRMLDQLNMASEHAHLDRWYVDVGMEVVRPYHVVQWLSGAHEQLLQHALSTLPASSITSLHEGSLFSRDTAAHLFDLSGFRCHPGARGRPSQVAHIQLYTTDKTVTYQLHHGAFSLHSTPSLYPGAITKLLSDIDIIAKMFTECAGANGQSQDGTARFEIRVGMAKAMSTLNTFPAELLRASAICIPNAIWWDFKFCRVAAINYVLEEMASDPPRSRALVPSLALGAVLIYMLNATISRPGDWGAERALAEACAL